MQVSFCELGAVQNDCCAEHTWKMTSTALCQPTHCEKNNMSEGLRQSNGYLGQVPNIISNDKLKTSVYYAILVITSTCP